MRIVVLVRIVMQVRKVRIVMQYTNIAGKNSNAVRIVMLLKIVM